MKKRYRAFFVLSILAGASGIMGIKACRLMADEAFPFVYFVGCDAYWPLLFLFAAGLLAASYFCFCKKAAPPLVFGPLAALTLLYDCPYGSPLFPLPVFRRGGRGDSAADV